MADVFSVRVSPDLADLMQEAFSVSGYETMASWARHWLEAVAHQQLAATDLVTTARVGERPGPANEHSGSA